MVNSRRKGAANELLIAKQLKERLGIEARRAQQYSGVAGDADLVTSAENLFFEVKARESLNLFAAMDVATSQAGQRVPVVIWKKNRKTPLVCVPIDRVKEFCQEVMRCQLQAVSSGTVEKEPFTES